LIVVNNDDERKYETEGVTIIVYVEALSLNFSVDFLEVSWKLRFILLNGLTFGSRIVHINHRNYEDKREKTRELTRHYLRFL